MAKLISKTYGDALFELAVEEEKVDVISEEILEIRKILEDNPEFGSLMNHPKITKEEKLQMAQQVFGDRISKELMGFLTIIISKDRYTDIDAILDFFIAEVKKYKGIGIAIVTTALPLKEQQCRSVEEKLLQTTGFREMEMHYETDPSLIGGMVIRIGDRVVDSSIRTKLTDLERTLLKVQVG